MSEIAEQMKCQIEQLPLEDRAELASFLLDSLNGESRRLTEKEQQEVDTAWKEEIARRVEKINDGTAVLIPGEEVFARMRKEYP